MVGRNRRCRRCSDLERGQGSHSLVYVLLIVPSFNNALTVRPVHIYRTQFGWGTSNVTVLSIVLTLGLGGGSILSNRLFPIFGFTNVILGFCAFGAMAACCLGFMTNNLLVWLFCAILAASWGTHPGFKGMLTLEVPSEHQGQLQGGLQSLGQLSSVAGLFVYFQVYYSTYPAHLAAGSSAMLHNTGFSAIWFLSGGFLACAGLSVLATGKADTNVCKEATSPRPNLILTGISDEDNL